jgi:hypothetical protein
VPLPDDPAQRAAVRSAFKSRCLEVDRDPPSAASEHLEQDLERLAWCALHFTCCAGLPLAMLALGLAPPAPTTLGDPLFVGPLLLLGPGTLVLTGFGEERMRQPDAWLEALVLNLVTWLSMMLFALPFAP